MGTTVMNMVLRSYCHGFNNSLITYLSNAYGAKQYDYLKVLMSRAKIAYTALLIPFLILLMFTKNILIWFGQDIELAESTGDYVCIAMFGFVAHLHYDIYRKFLNSMKMFCIHSPVTLISLSLHVFWCNLLIVNYKMELIGAALTVLIQFWTNFILIYSVVNILGYGKHFDSTCDSRAFSRWCEIFKDGFPTYILQLISFFTIESVLFISGYLKLEILIANTALVNLMNILYLLVYGVMQSSGPLIGNRVGEGNETGVIKLIRAVLVFGVLFSVFIVVMILLLSEYIFYIYVHDQVVLDEMYKIMPVFIATLVCYIFKDITQTIIIGLGLQEKTMYFNVISYILLGIPTALLFTLYLENEHSGPWLGSCIALFVNTIYYLYLYYRCDLDDIIAKVRTCNNEC